jgi:hypothetical protein
MNEPKLFTAIPYLEPLGDPQTRAQFEELNRLAESIPRGAAVGAYFAHYIGIGNMGIALAEKTGQDPAPFRLLLSRALKVNNEYRAKHGYPPERTKPKRPKEIATTATARTPKAGRPVITPWGN